MTTKITRYRCQCGAEAASHDALDRHCKAAGHSHDKTTPNPDWEARAERHEQKRYARVDKDNS